MDNHHYGPAPEVENFEALTRNVSESARSILEELVDVGLLEKDYLNQRIYFRLHFEPEDIGALQFLISVQTSLIEEYNDSIYREQFRKEWDERRAEELKRAIINKDLWERKSRVRSILIKAKIRGHDDAFRSMGEYISRNRYHGNGHAMQDREEVSGDRANN